MSYIGIVGHEAAKFDAEHEEAARFIIRHILREPGCTLVSGHCPLGGIDIWAEEEADALGREKLIFPPRTNNWEDGFKPRNLQIAHRSDIVHCIVVSELPPSYTGRRFSYCYHCKSSDHIKSGGCWTALRCLKNQWWVL